MSAVVVGKTRPGVVCALHTDEALLGQERTEAEARVSWSRNHSIYCSPWTVPVRKNNHFITIINRLLIKELFNDNELTVKWQWVYLCGDIICHDIYDAVWKYNIIIFQFKRIEKYYNYNFYRGENRLSVLRLKTVERVHKEDKKI